MKFNQRNKFKKVYGSKLFYKEKENVFLNYLPEIFLATFFALLFIFSSMFFANHKYYQVNQFSMQPLLNNYGDSPITDGVFVAVDAKLEVGDIFVIEYKGSTIIKRLIAAGGDKVAIVKRATTSGVEYVVQRIAKGTNLPYVLVEPYIKNVAGMSETYDNFELYLKETTKKETIKGVTYLVLEENQIFYLGDNRGKSYDSSNYGPGLVEDVVGKVCIIVFKEQNMLFHIIQYIFGFKKI